MRPGLADLEERYLGGTEETDPWCLPVLAADASADIDPVAADVVEATGGHGARDPRKGHRWSKARDHDLPAVRVAGDHQVDPRVRPQPEGDIGAVRQEDADIVVASFGLEPLDDLLGLPSRESQLHAPDREPAVADIKMDDVVQEQTDLRVWKDLLD